jgi:hypothetical protein
MVKIKSSSIIGVIGIVAVFLVLLAAGLSFSAAVVMFAWNLVIPYLFGLPQVSFWQAGGLLLLAQSVVGVISLANKVNKNDWYGA